LKAYTGLRQYGIQTKWSRHGFARKSPAKGTGILTVLTEVFFWNVITLSNCGKLFIELIRFFRCVPRPLPGKVSLDCAMGKLKLSLKAYAFSTTTLLAIRA